MNQSQFVPLKKEIELAQYYVSIEEARFEERLAVVFDVDCDLSVMVPNMVLQPVVENAVNHGVLSKEEGGRINVSIKKNGKMISFRVRDNGVGMEPELLNGIFKQKGASRVGLHNINSRLIELFGKGIEISSSPGDGTEVRWTVPINWKETKK